jgi:hypothetical protein
MYRVKILFLSLLAVFAASSVASATASAELNGPWWKHFNCCLEQVKFHENEEQALKVKNVANFKLVGTLLGEKVLIECTAVNGSGWLWNGLHQGEDEGTEVRFENCIAKTLVLKECKVTVEPLKHVYSELMWKYRGEAKELKEAGGQQKIYDPFGIEANAEGKFIFTRITTVTPCAVIETFPVTAAGTPATFFDQHEVAHQIKWGTAPVVEPQNEDVTQGFLTWTLPNVTRLHHQEKEVIAKLEFGGKPAELEGKLAVELNNGEKFGAFNE